MCNAPVFEPSPIIWSSSTNRNSSSRPFSTLRAATSLPSFSARPPSDGGGGRSRSYSSPSHGGCRADRVGAPRRMPCALMWPAQAHTVRPCTTPPRVAATDVRGNPQSHPHGRHYTSASISEQVAASDHIGWWQRACQFGHRGVERGMAQIGGDFGEGREYEGALGDAGMGDT